MLIQGYYGASDNPCTIFFYGGWYVVKGSTNVNFTIDKIERGVNVETLHDLDMFEADNPVMCEDDLMREIEDYES